jgi:hypothetical protein
MNVKGTRLLALAAFRPTQATPCTVNGPHAYSIACTPSYAGRRVHATAQSAVPFTSSTTSAMTSSISPIS